jgi:hypothetical protein
VLGEGDLLSLGSTLSDHDAAEASLAADLVLPAAPPSVRALARSRRAARRAPDAARRGEGAQAISFEPGRSGNPLRVSLKNARAKQVPRAGPRQPGSRRRSPRLLRALFSSLP